MILIVAQRKLFLFFFQLIKLIPLQTVGPKYMLVNLDLLSFNGLILLILESRLLGHNHNLIRSLGRLEERLLLLAASLLLHVLFSRPLVVDAVPETYGLTVGVGLNRVSGLDLRCFEVVSFVIGLDYLSLLAGTSLGSEISMGF